MKYKLTNKKDRVLNLGKAAGKTLVFQPNETKDVDESVVSSYGDYFVQYVEGDFLDVQKIEDVEVVAKPTPAKKKTTKKKKNKSE